MDNRGSDLAHRHTIPAEVPTSSPERRPLAPNSLRINWDQSILTMARHKQGEQIVTRNESNAGIQSTLITGAIIIMGFVPAD
jgi:hypothetical protein